MRLLLIRVRMAIESFFITMALKKLKFQVNGSLNPYRIYYKYCESSISIHDTTINLYLVGEIWRLDVNSVNYMQVTDQGFKNIYDAYLEEIQNTINRFYGD